MIPICIKVAEVAELLGVRSDNLVRWTRRMGYPMFNLQRAALGRGTNGAPLYMSVKTAVEVVSRTMGERCDRLIRRRLNSAGKKLQKRWKDVPLEVVPSTGPPD